MRFLLLNDIHLSDKPPRWRTSSYVDDLFDKLDQVAEIAQKSGCSVVACGGDVFHNPHPARVSHALVSRFIDWVDRLEISFAVVPGNHDMGSGGLGSIDRQPLGVVARHPGVQLLCSVGGATISDAEQPDNGYRPLMVGREWRYDIIPDWLLGAANDQANILLTHAPLARKTNPHYLTVQPEALAGEFSAVCFGHLHPPEEPYEINGTTFLNPGALSRGSLTPSDVDRTPGIFLVDCSSDGVVSIEKIPLRCKPSDQIFRADIANVEREANEAVEKFVSSLGTAVLESVTIEKLKSAAMGLCGEDQVAGALACDILDGVDA